MQCLRRRFLPWLCCAICLTTAACGLGPDPQDEMRLDRVSARVLQAAGTICTDIIRPSDLVDRHPDNWSSTELSLIIHPDTGGALGEPRGVEGAPAGPQVPNVPVEISGGRALAASTNGRRIKVTHAMMRFLAEEPELAFVLAHEAAHIMLDHSAAVSSADRRRQELEADRLALHVLDNAGYPLQSSVAVLERLATKNPGLRGGNPNYPPVSQRLQALHAEAKVLAGNRHDLTSPCPQDLAANPS